MKFELTDKQLEVIANTLAEMPWKVSYRAMEIIKSLKPIEKTEEKEKKE